ncbi:hypothetical protein PRUB_a2930 [Pseudoalteromonas rubra]|uniref:Uncharacterized protein n=1 Tax=Pseudoalteromonas rubra TaxID=43658 RepID=A0A8T0CE72_9GAMM|nr:hypothetical protein PRUB_a2930 [Pseudoalteromonas rubra]
MRANKPSLSTLKYLMPVIAMATPIARHKKFNTGLKKKNFMDGRNNAMKIHIKTRLDSITSALNE